MVKRNFKRMPKKNGLQKFNQGVKTVGNVARTAVTALGAAKLALSLINPEFKFVDVEATTTISQTANKILLNGLTKGTDSSNRIGRSIKMMSIELNFIVSKDTSDTGQEYCRVFLLLDKDSNGAVFNMSDVLANSGNQICSPRNLNNRKRFIILKEWVLPVGLSGNQQANYRQYYRKLDIHTIYDDSDAGTIADINSNALYLVTLGDSSTFNPSFTYYSRIRFLDN